jgi:hypothetical protein
MSAISERMRWYKNRLAAMSGAEIIYRLREAVRRKTDRIKSQHLGVSLRDYGALPSLPNLGANLDAWDVPEPLLAQWEQDSQRAQSGMPFMFGRQWPHSSQGNKWHLDPVSGSLWPSDVFCFTINYRLSTKNGDIKYVWELNRLQFLQPIAALARKRKDKALAIFCLNEIESWIDNNPPFYGVNWNSGIELALRVISILTVATLVGEHLTREARGKIWSTLRTHARWIARYPSQFSSGNNHRTAEGLGLFAVGALCPHFPEAAAWQNRGWEILCDAAQRQILPDGAGAEQALAYAASVCETLLAGYIIAQSKNIPLPDYFLRKLTLGGEYLRWMTDSSNGQPHIGDDDNACVFGAYHTTDAYVSSILSSIAAVTGRSDLTPPQPLSHLRQALFGIAPLPNFPPYGTRSFAHGGMTIGRHKNPRGDVLLVFDHGYLGYLSIAAHGHADTLALWLHIDGQPIFVDAGTYLYHSETHERQYFRSTAAHNTLTVSGEDSSTMAGNFNWSRKATATLRSFTSRGDFWQVEAEHDGYLENFHVLHRRGLHVSPSSGAVLEDWLVGIGPQHVEISFLLHPDLNAHQEGPEILILKGEQLLLRLRHQSPLDITIGRPNTPEGGWYSPEFGSKKPTTRLTFSGSLPTDQKATTRLYWA